MPELQELLTEHLRDLYDAEKQLTKALPKMAKAASNEELKRAFLQHSEVTQNQVARIEQAFEHLGEKAKGKPCKGMKGLVDEGQEHMSEQDKGPLRDCVLTSAAEKVEHYEMAAYMTARSLAKTIGQSAVAGLMQETLREEEQAGNLMLQIAQKLQQELKQSSSAENRTRGEREKRAAAGQPAMARNRQSGTAGSRVTTDHDEIRRWAEERGATPAAVKGTGGRGDIGMIRLDFPGYSGAESLGKISWDDWFQKFDDEELALIYQETTAGGVKSNFNKLVSRSESTKNASRNRTASRSTPRRATRGGGKR